MPETFLHGVETITSPSEVIVNDIKTAVIGLMGTAITGDINKLILCTTESDDAQFGSTGSIPEALKSIRKQGAATIFVVNVGLPDSTPDAADFLGANTLGVRTGSKLFELCFSTYGFNPKIFITPRYSMVSGVITVLEGLAEKYRGHCYLDATEGITVTAAIALKSSGIWSAVTKRAKLCYPMVIDSITNTALPLSSFLAGVRANLDSTGDNAGGGFWVSSSNHTIKGISGLDTPITSSINDATSESNLLNAAGIVTVFNTFGTGYREWGNRVGSFPTDTTYSSFECVQRAKDIIDESIELAMLPYIDRPIIQAYIDSVRNTVNGYFNTLIARGALLEGSKCTYDVAKNPPSQLATGHIIFTNVFMSPTPAERITFDTTIDINLLKNLK